MPKDVILTPEGFEKLKTEIEHLSTDRRREVAERIKEAREFGDISENAEYDDAKNEQAMLEARIAQLEDKLRSATVIDHKDLCTDIVRVGSVVHVKDEKTGKSVKYTIVGSAEAKPAENKLSNESPVGKALIGHKRNEVVSVQVPARTRAQAEDHQDRRQLSRGRAGAITLPGDERDRGAQRRGAARAARRPPAQARAPARRGDRPVPARVLRRDADRARCAPPTRVSSPGDRDRHARARRRAHRRRRGQGKAAFVDLVDRSGRIQLLARVDVLGEEGFERLTSLDLGDLIGVDGKVIASRTRRADDLASRTSRCWPSRCARRPRSTTASRTSRPATATASST